MLQLVKIGIFLCGFSFTSALLLDDVCRHGWVHFRDRCYMFATEKETWTNAEFRCRVFGGHLAEIEDAETNKFLKDTAQMRNGNDQRHHYFIGLTDEALLDEWEWVESATKPNFTDWGNHQPDHNGNDEHCVLFYARDHYRWHDADCDDHNYFICEEEEVNSGGSIIG
ncbi:perlucin-like [Mytilus edulis]|uniref:perlucin-like n=1 Tax=Mytilus edulis TaxID=6550 RepID=UPI0039EEF6FC